MTSFWIIVAIMAPVVLFGGIVAFLVTRFALSVEEELRPRDEGKRWINFT